MENTIKKNQTAKIPTKNGGNYSYQYVDIAQIHEYLEANQMKYYQEIETNERNGNDYIITYRYINGKWEDKGIRGCRVVDATLYGNDNPAQKQGSAITYARRYSLLMAFGLATEDDDASSLNDNTIEAKPATPKQIQMLKKYYTGDNMTKLLEAKGIQKIEDITMKKASDLIRKIMDKENK